MKRLIYILFCAVTIAGSFSAKAVTDKEMEQARVIATQTYLRYANDGSDYLDALHPTTMAELESKLKNKEKENIKAFKAIPVPKDYASWDKAQLVEYWSTTAFASKGLTDKGKIGKARAKKKLNNMTVSAPAKKTEPAAAAPAQPAPKAEAQQPKDTKNGDSAPTDKNLTATEKPELGIDSANIAIEEQQAVTQATLDAEDDVQIKKVKNNTWIYVVILIILVGVVVALVVFASNIMKKNTGNSGASGADASNEKALRSKLKAVSSRLEEVTRENEELRSRIESLTAELAAQRQRSGRQPSVIPSSPKPSAESSQTRPTPEPTPVRPVASSAPRAASAATGAGRTGARTIYLARANSKGIFVRADRELNPDFSIFRLDTTDGFAGSFRVVNDPMVIEKIQQNPLAELANACIGPDLDDPDGLENIVTDSAGTAIFESGRWKVSRKAKIHYE